MIQEQETVDEYGDRWIPVVRKNHVIPSYYKYTHNETLTMGV